MKLLYWCIFLHCYAWIGNAAPGKRSFDKRKHKGNKNKKLLKEMFLNSWAVVVHGDEQLAAKIAAENGFMNKGRVFENIYRFEHRGIPRRRKRASLVLTKHLRRDARVVWVQQQKSKIRSRRSIFFNDHRWEDQWYLYQSDPDFKHLDINVVPVWERGITGKGIVISILDDGIEYTHPELRDNYDPKASYDYNSNDTDPMPRYTWRDENKHGTRCASEVAAVANNSNCIVGVAYGASIGGIRMLDGEITDMVEALSLRHARDHIDIYSSSWGPEDDGSTLEGPGKLTKIALEEGAKLGRQGKGSIVVWASGNGGQKGDYCNCDGYTNSIYTISVSAATSVGTMPEYLESCASTLVSTFSSGNNLNEKPIVTADLSSKCTDKHTGTSVSPPLVAGVIALALEVNPNLSWRDVQHILVETSSLENLRNNDLHTNGVGRKYSHQFGFGVVNGHELVSLAEKWPTVSEQRKCQHQKEFRKFPHDRFNKSTPLVIEINSTACEGSPHHIKYVEHVQILTSFYHYRRGATEILIISPMQTESWVLRERSNDIIPGEFSHWKFLSVHFWGENPSGTWKIIFFSKEKDEYGQGFLTKISLILHGTEQKPGVGNSGDSKGTPHRCHAECKMGCTGPNNHECITCQHYQYIGTDSKNYCIKECPEKTYKVESTMMCLPCHPSCLTCTSSNRTHCISCPPELSLLSGACLQTCPKKMFRAVDSYDKTKSVCKECSKRCTECNGKSTICSACESGSILQGTTCVPRCSRNEWFDGEICQLCHETCRTCLGDSHLNCTSCPKKKLNDIENRYLFMEHQCLADCPLGYFKENTFAGKCKSCSKHCVRCSDEGRKCDICDVHYYRVTTRDRQCVEMCPAGYYADIVRRLCEPCNHPCNSCVPGKPAVCTSCAEGYFQKGQECVPSSECNNRYFVNKTSGKCLPCKAPCESCKSANQCISCFFNYYLTPSGRCTEICPSKSFSWFRTNQCQGCHRSCAKCDGPTARDCTSCPTGYYLLNGVCKLDIPVGYYVQITSQGSAILDSCHHTCQTCSGPSSSECLSCIEQLDKRESSCINPCPKQFLSENSCQNCHPSCKSCFGPTAYQCLECHSNFTLNIDTHTCDKACHRKFYKHSESLTCKQCHQSCAACDGPKSNQCLTCPEKLNFYKNNCVRQCPSGWYKTLAQVCTPCSKSCTKCLFKSDFCTHCAAAEVWSDYKCLKSCGKRRFFDESRRCLPCHDSCLYCNGAAPNECTACQDGMTLHNGMCYIGCVPGFYNNRRRNNCMPCMENCLSCYETINDELKCLVCSNSTVLQPDGYCGTACPVSSFQLPTDNVCKTCLGRGCIRCDKDLGRSCSLCMPLYQLSNGLCKSTCGIGNYPDEKFNECRKCHSLCASCYGPTEKDCRRCSSTALTIISDDKEITCAATCPSGYFSTNELCTACKPECAECVSKEKCSLCRPPLILHKFKCIPTCPNGFYANEKENTCVSCRLTFGQCALCDAGSCRQCKPGLYISGSSCTYDCGPLHVGIQNKCVACESLFKNCLKCNDTSCIQCKRHYQVANGRCILACENGYRNVNGTCDNATINTDTRNSSSEAKAFALSGDKSSSERRLALLSNQSSLFVSSTEKPTNGTPIDMIHTDVSGKHSKGLTKNNDDLVPDTSGGEITEKSSDTISKQGMASHPPKDVVPVKVRNGKTPVLGD